MRKKTFLSLIAKTGFLALILCPVLGVPAVAQVDAAPSRHPHIMRTIDSLTGATVLEFPLPQGGVAEEETQGIPECEDQYNGTYVDIAMDFTTSALPTGIVREVFSPNPTDAWWQYGFVSANATVTAAHDAPLGDATWEDIATEVSQCPEGYLDGGGDAPDGFTIIPGVKGPKGHYIWWFGTDPSGAPIQPAGYATTATLSLPKMQSANGPFTWTITTGTAELEFLDSSGTAQGQTITTTDPSVTVQSIGASPAGSAQINDITIKVSTGGVTYPDYKMAVRRPYENTLFGQNPACAPASANPKLGTGYVGFWCEIAYATFDNFGDPMFASISINENWDNVTYANANINWPSNLQCTAQTHFCVPVDPNNWDDNIIESYDTPVSTSGTCDNPDYSQPTVGSPLPLVPQILTCTDLLMEFSVGGWWVGSGTPGQGIQVQSNTWLWYLDHGYHGSIVSPVDPN